MSFLPGKEQKRSLPRQKGVKSSEPSQAKRGEPSQAKSSEPSQAKSSEPFQAKKEPSRKKKRIVNLGSSKP